MPQEIEPDRKLVFSDDDLISNAEFLEFTKQAIDGKIPDEIYHRPGYPETMKLNLRRFDGWQDRIRLNEDLVEAVRALPEPQHWVLVNEPWCGDGAFTQPLFQEIADRSEGKVRLSIVLRDRHPEIMDQLLTGSARAIPKLAALGSNDRILFTWGARPAELQEIISEKMREGIEVEAKIALATRWYIRDKGVAAQEELLERIRETTHSRS